MGKGDILMSDENYKMEKDRECLMCNLGGNKVRGLHCHTMLSITINHYYCLVLVLMTTWSTVQFDN